jgi:hypothetical protein
MVPPLVNMNRKYYGTRIAFYIAGVMYVSIVITALILNYSFDLLGILPESSRKVTEVTQFKIDYSFYFNIVFAAFTALMLYFNFKTKKMDRMGDDGGGISIKRIIIYIFALIVAIGMLIYLI